MERVRVSAAALWGRDRMALAARPGRALASNEKAVNVRRELAARWPDAYSHEFENSLRMVAWLEYGDYPAKRRRRSVAGDNVIFSVIRAFHI
jgi:hypothetical protein